MLASLSLIAEFTFSLGFSRRHRLRINVYSSGWRNGRISAANPTPANNPHSTDGSGTAATDAVGVLEKLLLWMNTAESRLVSDVSARASFTVCCPGASPVIVAVRGTVKPR